MMKSWTRRILPQLTIPLLALAAVPALASTALVLHNANIYTGDASAPRAEAILIVDGRIAYVGSGSEALRRAPPETRKLDLGGLTVLPGLTDSHAHLSGIGWRELYFDLTGVESLAALQWRLRKRAAGDKSAWLVGRGWIESRWTPAAFPAREDLDAVVADRPVVLERIDGHAIVVNSLALKIAGITRDTPNPTDGEILKNPITGEPTGMLIDGARALVEDLVPPPTDAETRLALETGANRSVSVGWTQLQYAGTSDAEIRLLCELYSEKKISLRVYAAIDGPGRGRRAAARAAAAGPGSCDDRLIVRAYQALHGRRARLARRGARLQPYSDSPGSTGLLRNEPDEVLRIATAALKRGIQVETHAIGDRGNRLVLDHYEKALAECAAVRTRRRRAALSDRARAGAGPCRHSALSRNSASSPRCRRRTRSATCCSPRAARA